MRNPSVWTRRLPVADDLKAAMSRNGAESALKSPVAGGAGASSSQLERHGNRYCGVHLASSGSLTF